MSVNMLELAKGALGGQVLNQLGGLLGEDTGKTQSALDGILPAILGGMMQTGSTPAGMQGLDRMAAEADGGLMDNIGDLLSNNSGMLMTLGAPLLAMLFGGKQDGLISTIARIAGVGGGSAGTLLKVVAPLVMSMFAKKKTEMSLNTDQFKNFLMDQKDHVSSAMPADVSSAIGFGDFLNQGSAPAAGATATASTSAPHAANDAAPQAGGGGLMKMLLPLAVIAGLAYVGYTMFIKSDPTELAGVSTEVQEKVTSLNETVGGLATTITGITDTDSATAAVDSIKSATETVDGLGLDALEGPAKTAVGGVLGGLVTTINGALETAYKIPGVEAIIKPAIEPLMAKLGGL